MKKLTRLICIAALSAASLLVAQFAHSQILSVAADTSNNRVSPNLSSQVQLNWRVEVQARNAGLLTVRSVNGLFLAPNRETQLGTAATLLTQNRTLNRAQRATINIRESLVVPQTVVRQAQQLGFSQILFLRTFNDTPENTTATAIVSINLTSSSGVGQVTIDRIQMQFNNGKRITQLSEGQELQAEALVRYRGSGMIEYTWEIASPPSTQGQAFFTPMLSRKQFVLAGSEIKLQSPVLPNTRRGLYLVRLKINNPSPNFEIPALRYTLVPSQIEQPKTLYLGGPPESAVLSNKTRFSWQPVLGAKIYQVEIFAGQVGDSQPMISQLKRPITGTQVLADKTQLQFNSVSLSHLSSGNDYFWRVIAIDQQGKVLAISKLRRLKY